MTDIYSFGMTIYEIFAGMSPFSATPDGLLFAVVYDRGLRPARPEDGEDGHEICDNTWALIEQCWAQDARKRPATADVVSELERIVE